MSVSQGQHAGLDPHPTRHEILTQRDDPVLPLVGRDQVWQDRPAGHHLTATTRVRLDLRRGGQGDGDTRTDSTDRLERCRTWLAASVSRPDASKACRWTAPAPAATEARAASASSLGVRGTRGWTRDPLRAASSRREVRWTMALDYRSRCSRGSVPVMRDDGTGHGEVAPASIQRSAGRTTETPPHS